MKLFPQTNYKKISLFKDVTQGQWNSWKWQSANAITDIITLKNVIDLGKKKETELRRCLNNFKMRVTPYYASLMDKRDNRCAIRLQVIPTIKELEDMSNNHQDSFYEALDSPVNGITHKCPDRVLFYATPVCFTYCRHCIQKRPAGFKDKHLYKDMLNKCIEYIAFHDKIKDVVISGGDPLSLDDDILENILKRLRQIKHIELIYIESRMPVVLPQRITESFVKMLKKYHPIYFQTQFNHPKEITYESRHACTTIVDAGIPLGNQNVLLKDINDCPFIMKKLVHKLLMIRVKPYYMYQCDHLKGISHFRTSNTQGVKIIENLRGHTSGQAVPTFVVDSPYGGGKMPVIPNYIFSH